MIPATKNKGPKACTTCAKAKSRCIPGPTTDRCERCHRLNKPCSSQTPAPPRKRKEPKPTRVAELERRLEDLTSRLDTVSRQNSQHQQPTPPESSDAVSPSPLPHFKDNNKVWDQRMPFAHLFPTEKPQEESDQGHDAPHHHHPRLDHAFSQGGGGGGGGRPEQVVSSSGSTDDNDDDEDVPMALAPSASATSTRDYSKVYFQAIEEPARSAELSWPQAQEAEDLLREYRGGTEKHFPFVTIPLAMTADELRRKRPFVWKAVMMAACHLDGARQIILGEQLVKEVTEATVFKPRKSLDLLQGLQLLLGWYHYNLSSFKMLNLLFLARSICSGLGLSEPSKLKEHTSESLERMRAYAGTYYLSSLTCTTAKKSDAMMSTPWLQTCCEILQQKMEYPSDEYLVQVIRIQQLAQNIAFTFACRGSGIQSDLPVNIIVKSFQPQIEAYRTLLPPELKDDSSVNAHIFIAEILLYEISLQDNNAPGAFLTPTDRLEMLWSCLNATKLYLNDRFAEPIQDSPRFLCLSALDYMYAFLTSLKLMTLQIPGWDIRRVRQELNFDSVLEHKIATMLALGGRRRRRNHAANAGAGTGAGGAAAGATTGRPPAEDPFERLARRMAELRVGLMAELDSLAAAPVEQPPQEEQNPIDFLSTPYLDITQGVFQEMGTVPDLFYAATMEPGLNSPPFMDFWASVT